MTTPICDFVKRYAAEEALRLHMPGHKGVSFLGIEELDITEIDGADVLYRARGIIRESEENASSLFGSQKTKYSTEGSSLCIRAMVYLAVLYAASLGRTPTILAARNAHKAFMSALALTDARACWLYGDQNDSLLSCRISPEALDATLCRMVEKPVAFYLTSPDYLGNLADVAALAEVCHRHGVLLLVDNAHGAYLRFLSPSRHPLSLGADLCCDSAHKTLPVLTGGAYLHIGTGAPAFFAEMAESAMELFASTSPSYLILQSLDAANRYLDEGYAEELADLIEGIEMLRRQLLAWELPLIGDEPLKLTFAPKAYGYTGEELAAHFRDRQIVCEFSDSDYCVLMLTPEVGFPSLMFIEGAITHLKQRAPIATLPPPAARPDRVLSVREAMMRPSVLCLIENAEGKILANAGISCPPAIPIAICGERLNHDCICLFRYYGIDQVRVVVE